MPTTITFLSHPYTWRPTAERNSSEVPSRQGQLARRSSWCSGTGPSSATAATCDAPRLHLELLPPKPVWRPLAVEAKTKEGEVRGIEVTQQSPEAQREFLGIEHAVLQHFAGQSLACPSRWLHVRHGRKVGFLDILPSDTAGPSAKSIALVVKQAGPLDTAAPHPLFFQERAWLRATAQQSDSPVLLTAIAEHSLLVMRRLPGEHLAPGNFTPTICGWAAEALAKLHSLPLGADMLRLRGERRFPWSLDSWLPFVLQQKKFPKQTEQKLLTLKQLLVSSLDQLPAIRTAIHGDPQPGNLLVDRERKCVHLIDFEFAGRGDPMFDLAFFAVSVHLPMTAALALLQPYHGALTPHGAAAQPSDTPRLMLYVAYQRLFRHVASHQEYKAKAGSANQYDRWLSRLHDDVSYLQDTNILSAKYLLT